MPQPRVIITPALALVAALLPAHGTSQAVDPDRLRAHTAFLAHDLLEGRGTASRGEALAALYIATRLRELGLEPLSDDFRLPVPLIAYRPDSGAVLMVHGDDEVRILKPPLFYHPGGDPPSFRDFAGRLILAGATPGAIEALDALPDTDLTGRVVVLGPPWTGIDEVEAELLRRGAAGAIEAVPDPFYHRLRLVRGPVRFALDRDRYPAVGSGTDASAYNGDLAGKALPRIVVGPEAIDVLGIADAVRPGRSLAAARTLNRVEVDFTLSPEPRTGYNLVGRLPGADPDRASETIVVLAHYDHVGFGQPEEGDSIWNGFADNATGVATVLELARALAADPPARSVLFLFTTAEEQGLLGATRFVEEPPIPIDRIRAVINLDGAAPPAEISSWTIAAPERSKLRDRAAAALRRAGQLVELRPVISDSDHWAFHRRGVPALFLYPGEITDGIQPHTPHDEWRPDFPFDGLARYAEAALAVVRDLADSP